MSEAPALLQPTDPTLGALSGPTDERVFFSRETQTWRFEDDNGVEWEWDTTKNKWVQDLDEEIVKSQQAAYSVEGVDEDALAAPFAARFAKKRKEVDYTSNTATDAPGPSIKRAKNQKSANKPPREPQSKNTAVYVTGLPPDATVEEIAARFSKCGLLMEDDDEQPKIKLYAFEDGTFNGEALVVFFMEESVTLALNLLDEAELRLGDPSTKMSVKKGEFGHKSGGGGEANTVKRVVDKKKATKRIVRMKNKLADWDSDDEFGPSKDSSKSSASVNTRVVVLKHIFTLKELEEDATLLLELKEDVREECETLGEVTNVVLYDKEEDGVMTAKFRDPLSAQACIIKMNGRYFDGRQVEARLYDGQERYQRSGTGNDDDDDDDEAEKKRLDAFASWLEGDQ